MAMIRVRAEADVGDHDELVAELLLESLAGPLHRAVRRGGRAAVGRLAAVLGMAEQEHRADAELEVLADRLHDGLEALLRDPGHRRDRLVRSFLGQHEVRHDQLLRGHVRLGDEVAEPARAPQPAQPRARRRNRDARLSHFRCLRLRGAPARGRFRIHCIASKIPSKLGSRASAVTSRPSARAAAVVDGPIV